jgi:hypothetical protein
VDPPVDVGGWESAERAPGTPTGAKGGSVM